MVDLSGGGGHLAILGAPRTGKSTTLRTLVTAAALTHTPADVAFYCVDFGGGALGPLAGLPHVGGVAGAAARRPGTPDRTARWPRSSTGGSGCSPSTTSTRPRRCAPAPRRPAARAGGRRHRARRRRLRGAARPSTRTWPRSSATSPPAGSRTGSTWCSPPAASPTSGCSCRRRSARRSSWPSTTRWTPSSPAAPRRTCVRRRRVAAWSRAASSGTSRCRGSTAPPRPDGSAAALDELVARVAAAWTGPPVPEIRLLPTLLRLDDAARDPDRRPAGPPRRRRDRAAAGGAGPARRRPAPARARRRRVRPVQPAAAGRRAT